MSDLAALTMRSRGTVATLRPRNGATRQTHGIFSDRVALADAGGRPVAGREISLTLTALAAEGVLPGDQVDVAGATYAVRSQSGDGNIRTLELAP